MLSLPVIFAAVLMIQPPAAPGEPLAQLSVALEGLGSAEPAASVEAIEAALAQLAEQPSLAGDEAAQDKLAEARVSLAWLHLAQGDQAAAAAAMDEALRSARGRSLEPGRFGPAVLDLHDARKAALAKAGSATIEVDCKVPCTVVINEQLAPNPAPDLALGSYRVWVGASEASDPSWARHQVELDRAGATATVVFDDPAPVLVPVDVPLAPPPPPVKVKRKLPRWAEIVGVTAGIGLAATGAALLALNGKCRGGGDPLTCAFVYDNAIQGASLLAAGGAVFLSFGALLTVDEVQVGRAKGRQATLTWTMKLGQAPQPSDSSAKLGIPRGSSSKSRTRQVCTATLAPYIRGTKGR